MAPRRPEIRLLFDELLPYRVAEALHVLKFRTSYVGNAKHGQPVRGSEDEAVLRHAAGTNQIPVTWNHDMIILCKELDQTVIWIDPRGRQFLHDELAVLAFQGIAEWARVLSAQTGPVCLRVLRTKVEVISLDRAATLAKRRMRAIAAKRRRKGAPKRQVPGQISSHDV